jgi:hypothetical protein
MKGGSDLNKTTCGFELGRGKVNRLAPIYRHSTKNQTDKKP